MSLTVKETGGGGAPAIEAGTYPARCAVSFRKTASVQIDDQDNLIRWLEQNGYDGCLKYKDPEVSKTELGKLMKAGTPVPFAYIKESQSVGVK